MNFNHENYYIPKLLFANACIKTEFVFAYVHLIVSRYDENKSDQAKKYSTDSFHSIFINAKN